MTFIMKQIIAGAALAEVTAGLRLGNTSQVSTATTDAVSLVQKGDNPLIENAHKFQAKFISAGKVTDEMKNLMFEVIFDGVVVRKKEDEWAAKRAEIEEICSQDLFKELKAIFDAVVKCRDAANRGVNDGTASDADEFYEEESHNFPLLSKDQMKKIFDHVENNGLVF